MVANDLKSLLNAAVQDPHDFPPPDVAPGLRQLDEALRCEICGDLYDAPMLLNLSFIDQCLRGTLTEHQQCPKCRQSATEVHMRKNIAVENAVKAWSAARALVLQLSKEEQDRQNAPPKRTDRSERPRKRRKTAQSSGQSSDSDVKIISGPSSPVNVKATSSVECPVCRKHVPFDVINQHIDSNCRKFSAGEQSSSKEKNNQKQQWSKVFDKGGVASSTRRSKEKERDTSKTPDEGYLPKVAYHTLKDKRINDLLNEYDLPTSGDRAAGIRRHEKWVVLYNANIDRTHDSRRTHEQLRRDLRRWEATLKPTAGSGSNSMSGSGSKKAVAADTTAYQAAHKAQFAQLVEAARPKKAASKPQTNESPDEIGVTQEQNGEPLQVTDSEPVAIGDSDSES
ncbi:hypothetical protein IEO21_00435 [Rhodonia placenta]|uniref:RING-type E3 ubiquitin transferase n=1 Tax=Rhodonia placenta TaxID=104341 RepID=A0A8H7PB89_9APHY|nr:hypothetical protein IEO21_00435 [Postia placenta]